MNLFRFKVAYCARIGGKDARDMARNVFKRLISATLGVKMNLTGQNRKAKIKESSLKSVRLLIL